MAEETSLLEALTSRRGPSSTDPRIFETPNF